MGNDITRKKFNKEQMWPNTSYKNYLQNFYETYLDRDDDMKYYEVHEIVKESQEIQQLFEDEGIGWVFSDKMLCKDGFFD